MIREPIFVTRRRYSRPADERPADARVYRLPVDVYMDDASIVLTASVPGLNADDLQITMDGEELVIRGEFNDIREDVQYVISERFHGRFERRLQINIPVNIDAAEATFNHGVLTLTLPKAEAARPRTIAVRTATTTVSNN